MTGSSRQRLQSHNKGKNMEDAHKPHHVEHVHHDREGVRDHRREEDCPGDEEATEFPDGGVVTPQSGGNSPPPPPPKNP